MGRRLLRPIGLALAAFALTAAPAAADPITLPLEQPEPISGLQPLLAVPLALGDPDAELLAVADDQLAAAGSSVAAPLLLDGTLVVDDDLVQCPTADFTSIQAAVTAAAPGDTVRVCPGLYNETVTVPKTLTLQAPRHQGQATQCQADPISDPTRAAIVRGAAFFSFNLQANDIVLEGFTVEGRTDGPGIYTSPLFSGYLIRHNVVQDNVFGLYFNASGTTESVASHNCFRANNRRGAASGNGVYTDQGLRNALVTENYFTGGHTNASIVLTTTGAPLENVQVTHNDVVDDSSIVAFLTQDLVVDHNHLVRPSGSGIFLGGGVAGAHVGTNLISNATGSGIRVTDIAGVPNTDLTIENNRIEGSLNGIRVSQAVDALIQRNRAYSNIQAGLRMDADTAGNTILLNHMRANGTFDCRDDSTGPFPGLVANEWINDKGTTENKPGLCRRGQA